MDSDIAIIVDTVKKSNAKSILEIEPGLGKYGILIKEYCDISNIDASISNTELETQKVIYNNLLINKDLLNIDYSNYNLVLLLNIIENLSIDYGKNIIDNILQDSKLIILTPKVNMWTNTDINKLTTLWDWTMLPVPSKDISTIDSLIFYYE